MSFYDSNGTVDYLGYFTNPNLASIIIYKLCSEIKSMSDYAWGADTGITIYGSNNEVCDAF